MGQFSWLCCVSGDALIEKLSTVKDESERSAYLVTPTETYFEPCYEGYGEFGGKDVYALLGNGDRGLGIDLHFGNRAPFDIKIVLADHYTGQTYDELSKSKDDPDQGWVSSRLDYCSDCGNTLDICHCGYCEDCGLDTSDCSCYCVNCFNHESECVCEEEEDEDED